MRTIPDVDDDLLRFLQSFFSTPRVTPAGDSANTFQWSADPKNNTLDIRAKDVTNAESIGKKPLIIVDRASAQLMQTSLKNRAFASITGDTETMLELMAIPYAIHCISAKDYEANILATMVASAFWVHRDEFRPLGYHKIRIDKIGSPSIILNEGESVAGYDVPVALSTIVNMHYTLNKNSPIVEGYNDGMLVRDIIVGRDDGSSIDTGQTAQEWAESQINDPNVPEATKNFIRQLANLEE